MISSKNPIRTDTAQIEIMTLHPYEMQLLRAIREKWRFGEMTIQARNGLPFRILRVQEFIDLTKDSVGNMV